MNNNILLEIVGGYLRPASAGLGVAGAAHKYNKGEMRAAVVQSLEAGASIAAIVSELAKKALPPLSGYLVAEEFLSAVEEIDEEGKISDARLASLVGGLAGISAAIVALPGIFTSATVLVLGAGLSVVSVGLGIYALDAVNEQKSYVLNNLWEDLDELVLQLGAELEGAVNHFGGEADDFAVTIGLLAAIESIGATIAGSNGSRSEAVRVVNSIIDASADRDAVDGGFAVIASLANLLQIEFSSIQKNSDALAGYRSAIGEFVDYLEEQTPRNETSVIAIPSYNDPDTFPAANYSPIIAHNARNSIAFRYALVHLNAFVVEGEVGLYSAHNQNGELDLYNPQTRSGLTDRYLDDRARFLVQLMNWNIGDGSPDLWTASDPLFFDDRALALTVDTTDRASEFPVNEATRYLFGGNDADELIGHGQNDVLYGHGGSDYLEGGLGLDYLEGGEGEDTYVAGYGDTLFDHDGLGQVLFEGDRLTGGLFDEDLGAYVSDRGDYHYVLSGADLSVLRVADGAFLTVTGFEGGHLGIDLRSASPPPPANQTPGLGSDESERLDGVIDSSVFDLEQVNAFNLPDHIQGFAGRDWIYAWDGSNQVNQDGTLLNSAPDTDIVEGGAGKDFIHGGAGDDLLYATDTSDESAIVAGQGSTDAAVSGTEAGDLVSGQLGDDKLYGSVRRDGLFGGEGDDLIFGGGGDDFIDGDWDVLVNPLAMDPATYDYAWYSADANGHITAVNLDALHVIGNDRIYGGDGNDEIRGGAGDDVVHGEAGDDRISGDMSGRDSTGNPLVPGEFHGNDLISGGAGDDSASGNGGNDSLLGGAGNDFLDGGFQILLGDDVLYLGDDLLDGGVGADTLTGNGGSDLLLGGDDDDELYGDIAGLDAVHHGDDVLYGGAGNDALVGYGGDDVLHGGGQDDTLYGDDIGESALSGADRLYGGSGDDELFGGRARDTLSGGKGIDFLEGGRGADTYVFSTGDSPESADGAASETVFDIAGTPGRLEFTSDVDPQSIRVTMLNDAGDVALRYANNDLIYIHGGLTGSIDTIRFGGGQPQSFQQYLSDLDQGLRHLDGDAGDDIVFGGRATDTLVGSGGNDTLLGGAGNDVLDGGSSGNTVFDNSHLVGGAGTDTCLFNVNPGATGFATSKHRIVDSKDRSGIVRFGAGIEATDLSYQDYLPHYSDVSISWGFSRLLIQDGANGDVVNRFEFADGTHYTFDELKTLLITPPVEINGSGVVDGSGGNDSITGSMGVDSLVGGEGRDWLDGGLGADVMEGGRGYDNYVVDDPNDAITEFTGEGWDTVRSTVDYVLPLHVEGLYLEGDNPLSGSGNALDNYIRGNNADNLLAGGSGDDYLHAGGFGGADTLLGGEGNDELHAKAANGLHVPQPEMRGGAGDDVYFLDSEFQIYLKPGIIELADEGDDTLVVSAQLVVLEALPDHVENVIYEFDHGPWTGSGAEISGNSLNNRIEIRDAQSSTGILLSGLAGDDTLIGSIYDDSTNHEGLFGGEGDDLLQGLSGDDYLVGEHGDDRLEGGAGNDLLDGGPGSDVLIGGAGLDTYVFRPGDGRAWIHDGDSANAIEFRNPSAYEPGISVGDIYQVVEQIGDLTIRYAFGDEIIVRDGAGGAVIDRFVFESDGAEYTLAELRAEVELQNRFNIIPGGEHDDSLVGTSDADLIEGYAGDDTLSGGSGNDRLIGGEGDDFLKGRSGVDEMFGGPGDDYYFVNQAGDVVIESPDAGIDTIQSYRDYTLVDHVEILRLKGQTDLDGLGNALHNQLYGNAGVNELAGDIGNDSLYGKGGDDVLAGGNGNDLLKGDNGDDQLRGDDGKDKLFGGGGTDTLVGGAGNDNMRGASGDDEYRYVLGDGKDVIDEQGSGSLADLLVFEDLDHDQLWFERSGDNLLVSPIGTSDRVKIRNWYEGDAGQVEQFTSADAMAASNTAIDQLVFAMAAFNKPAAGETNLSAHLREELAPALAAAWQSSA